MTEYPRCRAPEKTTDPNWVNECDGTLVPLSDVTASNVPLVYAKWKCTKCGRVVE